MNKNNVLPRSPTPPKRKTSTKNSLVLVFSILALLIAIVAFFTAQLNFHHYQTAKQELANLLLGENQRIEQSNASEQQFRQQISQRLQQSDLKLNRLLQEKQQLSAAQALSNAEALIQLAQWQVAFSLNGGDAIHLLTVATQLLQAYDSPSIVELRDKIKQDIATLQAIPAVDLTLLLASIDDLITKVQSISIIKPPSFESKTTENSDTTVSDKHSSAWDQIQKNLAKLSTLISIRKVDSQADFLLTPHQASLAKQLVLVKLVQAQWAVLSGDPSVFKQSLLSAKSLIDRLDIDNDKKHTMLNAIDTLVKQPVREKQAITLIALSQPLLDHKE